MEWKREHWWYLHRLHWTSDSFSHCGFSVSYVLPPVISSRCIKFHSFWGIKQTPTHKTKILTRTCSYWLGVGSVAGLRKVLKKVISQRFDGWAEKTGHSCTLQPRPQWPHIVFFRPKIKLAHTAQCGQLHWRQMYKLLVTYSPQPFLASEIAETAKLLQYTLIFLLTMFYKSNMVRRNKYCLKSNQDIAQ